jgi:DNA-binding transcriptional regulator YiaG
MLDVVQNNWMKAPRSEVRDEEGASERLLRLREALAGTQVEFCTRFGFAVSAWSNYERGSPIGKAAALKLVRKIHGLTLDWIYFGNSSGLTMEMAKRLGVIPPDDRPGA